MQLNIEGLNDCELMDIRLGHLRSNISYEIHFVKNLVENHLPMRCSITESNMIAGHLYVIGNMDSESLDDSFAMKTLVLFTNTQNNNNIGHKRDLDHIKNQFHKCNAKG